MYESADLLEAAKSIRPFLPQILGSEAQRVDSQLANLIAQHHADQSADDLMIELLAQNEGTRAWMEAFLQNRTQGSTRNYESLPGRLSGISAPKYICPQGNDYIWYRLDSSNPIPRCETHQVQLELSEDS